MSASDRGERRRSGARAECRCPIRSEQKTLHQIGGLGSQPRLTPQGVGQVQTVHGDLGHARQQELRQEHRIAVPRANHTPFGLGSSPR
ncbi:hypothetical protein ACFQ51_39585 [Streptomyces kaempferi]